ncbi:unnamed protein product [Rangifer tarandus platyrhynchus]|uniref:Uncharacterized protein n=1 Tax=Rangifer tarandus platyrhynchus TaxID=3082113 RepID=A0ABN8ZTK1_RANTA|nr:unnamed protein product [Rangifer tarandus platyrhynchus]
MRPEDENDLEMPHVAPLHRGHRAIRGMHSMHVPLGVGRGEEMHAQSCLTLFLASWAATHQVPLSMEFSRQEYWSGLPLPSPGDLPDPGMEPTTPVSHSLAGEFFTTASPGKPLMHTPNNLQITENVLLLTSVSLSHHCASQYEEN